MKIEDMIREKSNVGKDRMIEIQEIDVPYRIPDVKFFRSSYKFHIDPVPHDNWIFVDGKLRKGYEI
ncbi:hypothetical protein KY331_01570, partial [Candidatus Woesearchaeota archaeon]|nr:hypothetical protein [Candidatus Woesearchaeota archaeon]